jgi:hypothetical protein
MPKPEDEKIQPKPEPSKPARDLNEDINAGRRRTHDEAVKNATLPEPPEEKGVKKGGA